MKLDQEEIVWSNEANGCKYVFEVTVGRYLELWSLSERVN